jgi:uncharacterized protein YndB with AHSA1/START domain
MDAIAAVDHTVNVPLTPSEAFELFTGQMLRWWPLSSHSCSGASAKQLAVEPRVGGRLTEHAADGTVHLWGTVLEWDPPRGLAMTWHPGVPEAEATRVRVQFMGNGPFTDVRIVHDGWEARGADAAAKRGQYETGWPLVLARYAESAASYFSK